MDGASAHTGYTEAPIPARAGVGLKPEHYRDILEGRPDIGWFEVHAENFMGAGGPPHHFLSAIRERYPISLHGVGLSIGSAGDLDVDHLRRLRELIERYKPGLFSEHLAWSTHEGTYLNDLLPVPYTAETLERVSTHVDQVQQALGRRMLLENPSTYVKFDQSTLSELDFLDGVVRRTGCGLLLDVNNVQVSATNHGFDPVAYLEAFPVEHVGEMHLAGYDAGTDDEQRPLLIDTHDRPVLPDVWSLYRLAVRRAGPVPTLIEWDANVPTWPTLYAEAEAAERIMRERRTNDAATS
jgi:uncharacterized protein